MPFARLTLLPAPAPEQADHLNSALTELIARDLGKRHDLTSVLVESPDHARWTIGGDLRSVAAHLEVCVTAGTNSEEDKRAFLAHAMALLTEALPQLHPATYIVVRELPRMDWGYDGLSQADRARV